MKDNYKVNCNSSFDFELNIDYGIYLICIICIELIPQVQHIS